MSMVIAITLPIIIRPALTVMDTIAKLLPLPPPLYLQRLDSTVNTGCLELCSGFWIFVLLYVSMCVFTSDKNTKMINTKCFNDWTEMMILPTNMIRLEVFPS